MKEVEYSQQFSEDSFWKNIVKVGKKAGVSTVYAALVLYYTLQKPDLPVKAKTVILGALGYLIFPIDAIPDFTPIIGYGDDISVLIGALITVMIYIDENTKQKAKQKLTALFGEEALGSIKEIDNKIDTDNNKES